MKNKIVFISLCFLFLGCSNRPVQESTNPQELAFPADSQGCFLLYNLKTKVFEKEIGGEFCNEQYTPFSSFKVPLAVMALDAGILKDENQILKWDGKKDERPEVNQDHNAKTWMRDSVVWFSQRLTPKMGEKKFKKYLTDFDYGNKSTAGGLTQTWLVPPGSGQDALKISAREQVKFMEKLWTNQLPVKKEAMQKARDITYLETSPKGYRLSGKTGSNYFDKEKRIRFGWFISHLQNQDQEYIIITNFKDLKPTEVKSYGGPKAKEITKEFLAKLGLW